MESKWGMAWFLLMEIMVIGMIVVFGFTEVMPDFRKLSYWTHLESDGVLSDGFVLEKGVVDTLVVPTDGCLGCGLWVKVEFKGPDGAPIQRVFGVPRSDYHQYKPGEHLQVAYLLDMPEKYQIWESLEENEHKKSRARVGLALNIVVVSVLSLTVIFLAVIMYLTYRSRRRKGVQFKDKPTKCPQCGFPLQEGYVMSSVLCNPKGTRTRWRAGGLPGYRWYENMTPRRLPSYHCPNCKTILFKYE